MSLRLRKTYVKTKIGKLHPREVPLEKIIEEVRGGGEGKAPKKIYS